MYTVNFNVNWNKQCKHLAYNIGQKNNLGIKVKYQTQVYVGWDQSPLCFCVWSEGF